MKNYVVLHSFFKFIFHHKYNKIIILWYLWYFLQHSGHTPCNSTGRQNGPLVWDPEAVLPSPSSAAPRADGLRVLFIHGFGENMNRTYTTYADRMRLLLLCILFTSLSALLIELAVQNTPFEQANTSADIAHLGGTADP